MKKQSLVLVVALLLSIQLNAQDIQVTVRPEQPYDWLGNVPSSVTRTPTYTPDWSFIERMQGRANSQYIDGNRQNNIDYSVSTFHTLNTLDTINNKWSYGQPTYDPIYIYFKKQGLIFLSPGVGSRYLTFVKENGRVNFWEAARHEWCKVNIEDDGTHDIMTVENLNRKGVVYMSLTYLINK
jgi:hypothetical protein